MENIVANYSVREALLYPAMTRIWLNCIEHNAVMVAKKPLFTIAYCNERIALIEAAQSLPDEQQRSIGHELKRLQMVAQADVCRGFQQDLKVYINGAWESEETRELMYRLAGGDLYAASSGNSWVAINAMMNKGTEFMETYTVELSMTGTNMPGTFPELYNDAAATMRTLNTAFDQLRQLSKVQTAAKIESNNEMYKQTIDMGMAGQQFFRNSVIRSQFSFEAVCNMISPPGASSAILTVVDANTNQPVAAQVVDTATNRSLITSIDDGRAEFNQLSAGTSTFAVNADGYDSEDVTMQLTTGTTSRAKVLLQPAFVDTTDTIAVTPATATVANS